MIRVCITGGSGFIGTNAVALMLSKGYEVLNLDIKPPLEIGHHSYWKYVDIRKFDDLNAALMQFNPTHILHLAAVTGMDVKNLEVFDANILGVKNMIQASMELIELKRIIFTSSLLVCKNGYIPLLDTDYCPPNLYGVSKMMGEKLVRDVGNKIPWAIVRPTSIWGPWFDHSYKAFFRVIDKGLYVQPGFNEIYKPLSYVGNTVFMMEKILLSDSQHVNCETYYLADYPEISINTWASIIHRMMGKKNPKAVPLFVMHFLALFGDFLQLIGIKNFPINSFRLKNMITGASYPIEKIKLLAGPLPWGIDEGVSETIMWMKNKGLINANY